METLSRLNSYTDALKCRNLKGWCTRKRGSLGSLDSGYASNSGNSIETQPKTYESTETSDITTREFGNLLISSPGLSINKLSCKINYIIFGTRTKNLARGIFL